MRRIIIVVILVFGTSDSSLCQGWDPSFYVAGISTDVDRLFLLDDQLLLIGRGAERAGSAGSNYHDTEDGMLAFDVQESMWADPGAISGIPGILDIVERPDGTIIIGGSFTEIHGEPIAYVAALRDGMWEPMGMPLDGSVHDLEVNGDQLFIGGGFLRSGERELNRVAQWSGSEWLPLDTGLGVRDGFSISGINLQWHDGSLFVGGGIGSAGGIDVSGVAAWDGTSWNSMGGGLQLYDIGSPRLPANVFSITVWNESVIFGGSFDVAGNMDSKNIAAWNGVSWSSDIAEYHGYPEGRINQLSVSESGDLYAITNGAEGWQLVYRLRGEQWDALPHIQSITSSHLFRFPFDMIVLPGNRLVVGTARVIGGNSAIAQQMLFEWSDEEGWTTLDRDGKGLDGPAYAATTAPDGSMIVGGIFAYAGSTRAQSVAAWNGSEWESLGEGLDGEVFALAYDQNGVLYAGGNFYWDGDGEQMNHIARWNGTEWQPLSGGVTYLELPSEVAVYELTVVGDELHVGGMFSSAGGLSTSFHSIWDTDQETWRESDLKLNGPALSIFEDHDGALIFGGGFSEAVGQGGFNGMLRLDDGVAEPIGGGSQAVVWSMIRHEGQLYASGQYDGEIVGRFDGTDWEPYGEGLVDGTVFDFCVAPNGRLVAAGAMTAQPFNEGYPIGLLAVEDHGSWTAEWTGGFIGTGAQACLTRDESIFLFGSFSLMWSPPGGGSVIPTSGIARFVDATDLRNEEKVELPVAPTVSVFPNPASQTLSVEFSDDAPGVVRSIHIYDTMGRQVYSDQTLRSHAHGVKIDLAQASLSNGAYYLIVDSGTQRTQVPFVIVR